MRDFSYFVLAVSACFSTFTVLDGGASKAQAQEEDASVVSEAASFRIEVVTENMDVPWTMEFLPDGTALVGERGPGKLYRLDVKTGERTAISGLPDMLRDRKISSGLFDVRAHPNFAKNNWLYLAYGVGNTEGNGLAVDRYKLSGNSLSGGERLFEASPKISGKWHFGGRMAFSGGYLFLTTGDGYDHSARAQQLNAHAGKILRLHGDGRVPTDNPFVGVEGALPEIWSYGVRNPQGLDVNPTTGEIWANEHGPQGGDEVNIMRAGKNYGWPVITYGEEYGGGPIGDGITHKQGMEQPLYYWVPSIAPSGMEFYQGNAFARWKGNLFVGALALTHINRLVIEGERVIHEERLVADKGWRVRFIEEGPDGYLYFGVDDGMIMRLVPVD